MVKEVAVFIENRPGRLKTIAAILSENKINIRTMTLHDRGQFGLMKLIVDKPEQAYLSLADKGFACALKEILAVMHDDKPGSFNRVVSSLSEHNVNILDAYGFVIEPGKKAVFCFEVKDTAQVHEMLKKENFNLAGKELHEF